MASGYQNIKYPSLEPFTRFYIQYALLELQEVMENALSGVRPRRRQWVVLRAESFLQVLHDVTTWSLTHCETVISSCLAEELTSIEISEDLKLLGRHRRMTPANDTGGLRRRPHDSFPR